MRNPTSRRLADPPACSAAGTDAASAGARPAAIQQIRYDAARYHQYDHAGPADQAKKILEMQAVERLLAGRIPVPAASAWALDVGCATGRYLCWLAAQGFRVIGYDVEAAAVRLSHQAVAAMTHVEVCRRDILQHAPEAQRYRLITSMMGTFNHVARSHQGQFVRWVFDSLEDGGNFVFSSWNAACPHTGYLRCYTPAEQAFLRRNSCTIAEVQALLREAGFHMTTIAPVGYGHDAAYDHRRPPATAATVHAADQALAAHLSPDDAQMLVVCAARP